MVCACGDGRRFSARAVASPPREAPTWESVSACLLRSKRIVENSAYNDDGQIPVRIVGKAPRLFGGIRE
jgi:hypothetical protein